MSPDVAATPPAPWVGPPPVAAVDPRRLPPHLRPALPLEEREYHAFWRAPRFRWWKSLLAVAMVGLLFAVVTLVASLVGLALDGADLADLATTGQVEVGPGLFLANNVSLGLCIPIAMLTQWACLQQSPRWLSSVEGGLRWRWLALVGVALLPVWVVFVGGDLLLQPPTDVAWRDYSLLMITGILLTTPLQAAGEEYLVRGLLGRVVGSWFEAPLVGFIASTVFTTGVFMVLHGAGDPWLNAIYIAFGLTCSWLTWRTGGLEAAIALHVVNNLVGEAVLPFSDVSDVFDRQAGVADATDLLQVGLFVAAVAIVEVLARRRPMVRRAAPGRIEWQAPTAPAPACGDEPGGPSRAW